MNTNIESFRQPFASMKDIVLLSMKRVSTLYLSYREVINRLPLLAVGDLLLRILLYSQKLNEGFLQNWGAYVLVGALMLLVMGSNVLVNNLITFVSCYLIIEKLLPNKTGDTIESTVVEMIRKSDVNNDEFSINLYTKIMVTLGVFSCFCVVAHTIGLALRDSRQQFLVSICIIISVQSICYNLKNIVVVETIVLQEILNVISYISTCYAITRLWNLDRIMSIMLIMVHFKTMYYKELSFEYLGPLLFTIAWMTENDRNKYNYQNIFNEVYSKVSRLDSLFNNVIDVFMPYSIVVIIAICLKLKNKFLGGDVSIALQSVITILCSTAIGTVAYFAIVTLICIFFLNSIMFFLNGRPFGRIYREEVIGLSFIPLFLTLWSINQPVLVHGRLMCIALAFVSVSSLDVIQQKCEPILLETATSISSVLQCGKILLIFFLLVVIPPYALYLVLTTWLQHLNMLWTLVIVTSWISTTINAIGSLFSFCLLVYDNYRISPLDNLDDYIYYINLVTCSLHIVFGVFGVAVLLWDMVMVKWVWLNILVFGLNFYHIYTSVTDKWQEYKRRRVAAQRLSFLSDATGEELDRYNNDCAICLRPMTSAKKTPCNHYFHVACLKKWSYIRETCPMCNKVLNSDLVNQQFQIFLQQLMGIGQPRRRRQR